MINFFLISNLKIYWRNTTPYIGNVLKRKKHQENKVQCSSNPEREIQEKEGKTKHHSSWSHKDFKYWVDTYFNGYICLTHEDNSSQFSTAWCLEPSWSRILFQTNFFFSGLICEAIVAFWIGFVRLLSHWCWDWEICLKWVDGKIVNVFWCPYFHPTFLTNLRWLDLAGRVKNILTFPFSLLFFSCETNRTSQIFHPPFHSNQTQYKI